MKSILPINDPVAEIKAILDENEKTKKWLAKKLGVCPHKIYYLLENQKSISISDYSAIMDVFNRAGFLCGRNLIKGERQKVVSDLMGLRDTMEALIGNFDKIVKGLGE